MLVIIVMVGGELVSAVRNWRGVIFKSGIERQAVLGLTVTRNVRHGDLKSRH